MPNSSMSNGEILNISQTSISNNGTFNCKAENTMSPTNGKIERGIAEVTFEVNILCMLYSLFVYNKTTN